MSKKLARENSVVLKLPSKVLRAVCEPVNVEDAVERRELCKEIRNMWEAAGAHKGIAANQVGISKRIVLCRFDSVWLPKLSETCIMLNPEIIWTFGKKNSNEGCESVGPDRYIVKRPRVGKVRFYNELGELESKVFFYNKLRVICHEIDHLDGRLLPDVGKKWAGNAMYKRMSTKKGK